MGSSPSRLSIASQYQVVTRPDGLAAGPKGVTPRDGGKIGLYPVRWNRPRGATAPTCCASGSGPRCGPPPSFHARHDSCGCTSRAASESSEVPDTLCDTGSLHVKARAEVDGGRWQNGDRAAPREPRCGVA